MAFEVITWWMMVSSGPSPVKTSAEVDAVRGGVGWCFSVVYPLDVAKTRIQALPSNGKGKEKQQSSMLAVLTQIYKAEGLSGFYRGFGATMLNTFSMQYAYFFFYSLVRNSYISRLTRRLPAGSKLPPLSTAAELLIGAIAGALAQIFTIPVSVIATRQQVGRLEDSSEEPHDDSFLGVAREIIEEEGVGGLWLGLKPGLVLTVNPAITYGVFERVKSLSLLAQAKAGTATKLSPWMSFIIGAFSKTLATIVTYPYIMAKVRIQARCADSDDGHNVLPHTPHHVNTKHVGAIQILARVLKKEGFAGWYQGMQAQITKAVLSQALLFMSKEQFEHWALAIMIMAARVSSRQ
ncbi:putative mitochondrial carrier (TC 2.A.29) family protein [Lyophyllum shimeji]|uniref:Mitochondrial carrier (TC 2.A.29) family protein n=1 Tax=Lyophyllum shimeji TaxID=47721 RepID=A0A9P3UPG5_LYOSH|nr:putative mitochondrial carrier (TC 2.A.29) family protein [Lyophyllum shimeji]